MTQPTPQPQTQPTAQPMMQPRTQPAAQPPAQGEWNLGSGMNNCLEGMQSYTIQAGDSLWLISQRHSITVDEIMEANPGINANRLFVGQVICIPQSGGSRDMTSQAQPQAEIQPQTQSVIEENRRRRGRMNRCPDGLYPYTIQAEDTLWLISQRHFTTVEAIMEANPGVTPNNLFVGQVICIPRGTNRKVPERPRRRPRNEEERRGGRDERPCPGGLHSYIIEADDTLWLIAQRFQTTVEAIMAVNPGINPTNLFIGQVICIPYGQRLPIVCPSPRPQPQPQPVPQPQPQPMPQPQPQPRPQPRPVPQPQPLPQPQPQPRPQPQPVPRPQPVPQPQPQPRPQPVPQPVPQPQPQPQPPASITEAEQNLNSYLRLLWLQHVYWTRMVIESVAFDLPDVHVVTNRLLQNPKDFEEVLITFYGPDNAAKFAELLTTHLTIANELVMAMRDGNVEAASDAEKRWYENADQIAAYLASINPNWMMDDWQDILYDHLALVKTEANDILTQNFENSVSVFADNEREALEMADIMSMGIVQQFRQYFI
ncbi:LysM peptidoglycan-binding domain-containing protein [Lacrimispora saccharolytica]|nr:LysM peptidoglycan-binding domain-containing protein [Lacrimispora saccharolytica]